MPEGHAFLEGEQPFRRVNRGRRDPQALTGAAHEQRIADRLGRRDQQQAARVFGEAFELSQVARLDPLREIAAFQHPEPVGQLRDGQPSGKLQERQRVAPRLREYPVAHLPVDGEPHRRAQQCASVAVQQPAHLELRQVPQLLAGHARREHEPHRLGQQAAGHEAERQRRGLVQPLRVVDDAQQGTFLRGLGQQAEHGQADQEPIRRRPRGQAEDRPQRVTLRAGQPVDTIEQRYAQLVQARERQLHLGLDPDGPLDGQVRRRCDQVLQQRRLPDPRLAANHQRPTRAPADVLDQAVQQSALVSPTEKAHRGLDSPTPAPHRTRSVDSFSASPRGSQGACASRSSRAGLRAAA